MAVYRGARFLGFFWGIPKDVRPLFLYPCGLLRSQGKDTMTGVVSKL